MCTNSRIVIGGKYLLSIFSILENFLFAGIPYGWNSLVYILKSENVFSDLCPHNISTNASIYSNCNKQNERLNLIFSVGIASVLILVVYIGIVNTRLGEIKTRIIHEVLFPSGLLCFVFTSADTPRCLLPGLILTGVGGFALLLTNIRVATIFTRGSALYIAVLNGSFDSSVITFQLIKVLHDNGIQLYLSMIGILIGYIAISGTCTLLHWFVIDKKDMQNQATTKVEFENREGKDIYNDSMNKTAKNSSEKKMEGIHLGTICSKNFLMHLMWFCSNDLNYMFFLGSLNTTLEQVLQNSTKVSHFTNMIGYTMTAGILTSILAGSFQEWQKWCFSKSPTTSRQIFFPLVAPLGITSLLGLLLALLSLVKTAWSFYVIFGVVVLYRSFLFSVVMNYIIQVFPLQYKSLLIGISLSAYGLVSLLQYPLYVWRDLYEGANIHVTIVLTTLGSLSLLHCFRTYVTAINDRV